MNAVRRLAVAALACLFGAPALAETDDEAQVIKPFVWVFGGGYAGPAYYASTTDDTHQVGLSGDFFSRATAGIGFWEADAETAILPGWGKSTSGLDDAITLGAWFRLESALPATGETMGRSFGGSLCFVENNEDKRLVATMIDIGIRQSMEGLGTVRQGSDGENLQQFSFGFSEQINLFEEHYIGPAGRVHWGTDDLPFEIAVGLEIGTAL